MTKELTLNKVAAAFVGVAMVAGLAFAFAAERAHAITLSELVELFIALEVIPADKADEARAVLDGQDETPATPSTGTGSAACSANFTRNLTVGDTGADVKELQQLLNANGFTVATAGAPGSAGNETMYFGPATKAAVTAMQNAFASEILTPLGLTAGTGFFGASTRAKANTLCAGGPSTPPTPPTPPGMGDDDDDFTGDDDDDTLSGGEASFDKYDALNTPSSEDLKEGEEDAEVFGVEFDVEDGDVRISRVDVNFQSQTLSKEDEPWNALESVSLWMDGEKIAEENADSEDDWSDQGSDTYRLRFTGLSEVVEEDETGEIIVAVTVANNIDDSDLTQTWKVWIPTDGIRAIDGAGLDQYTGSNSDSETFDIEAAGANTELKITTASSNPDASTIKVDETTDTNDITVLVFDVEAEDGEVEVRRVVVYASSTDPAGGSAGGDLADIVKDVYLEIDGQTFDYDLFGAATTSTTNDGTGTAGYYIFNLSSNDDEFVIDEDDEIEGKIIVDFNDTNNAARYDNGATVEFDINADARSGWNADDVSGDALVNGSTITGTANGEQHELLSEGLFAEVVSVDADVRTINNGVDDVVDFEIKFDLTAFADTFYVGSTTGAVTYSIERNSVASTTLALEAPSLTSTADEEANGNFRIDDGDTETFTLSGTVNPEGPTESGAYRLVMTAVKYSATNSANVDDLTHVVSPVQDFRTPTGAVVQ